MVNHALAFVDLPGCKAVRPASVRIVAVFEFYPDGRAGQPQAFSEVIFKITDIGGRYAGGLIAVNNYP